MQGTLIAVRREIGVGEIIGGHWVVEGPLGEGGMAVVVAARHVKVLHPLHPAHPAAAHGGSKAKPVPKPKKHQLPGPFDAKPPNPHKP